jgi:putative transposase
MGKAKKHTPEQIVHILRQIEVAVANGKTYPVASREAGITGQTYYRWRKEYGGSGASYRRGQARSSDRTGKLAGANFPAQSETYA